MHLYKPSNIVKAILLEFGFAFLVLAVCFLLTVIALRIL